MLVLHELLLAQARECKAGSQLGKGAVFRLELFLFLGRKNKSGLDQTRPNWLFSTCFFCSFIHDQECLTSLHFVILKLQQPRPNLMMVLQVRTSLQISKRLIQVSEITGSFTLLLILRETNQLIVCQWWYYELIFTRWWFQILSIFTPTWGRFPSWLIFFRGVETTNQWYSEHIFTILVADRKSACCSLEVLAAGPGRLSKALKVDDWAWLMCDLLFILWSWTKMKSKRRWWKHSLWQTTSICKKQWEIIFQLNWKHIIYFLVVAKVYPFNQRLRFFFWDCQEGELLPMNIKVGGGVLSMEGWRVGAHVPHLETQTTQFF